MQSELTGQRLNDPMRRKVWPDDFRGDDDGDGATVGVRCPKCNCADTRVNYTRHRAGAMNLRSRKCRNCGRVFPTYERTA